MCDKAKVFLITLILFNSVNSQSIAETYEKIKSLQVELSIKMESLNAKINEIRRTDELFSEKSQFESDLDYVKRIGKALSKLDSVRKDNLSPVRHELVLLKNKSFATNNVTIRLSDYDANEQIYHISVNHNDYLNDDYNIDLSMTPRKAKLLFENWEETEKSGIIGFGIGEKIVLTGILITNPDISIDIKYDFNPFKVLRHKASINAVAFSLDGKLFATGWGSWNFGGVSIFDGVSFDEIAFFSTNGYVNSLAFSPGGDLVALSWNRVDEFSFETKGATIINLADSKILADIDMRINAVDFTPDGNYMVCDVDYDNNLYLFDINRKQGHKIQVFKYSTDITSIEFGDNGKYLVTGSNYGRINVLNVDANTTESFTVGGYIYDVSISPNGKYLAVGTDQNKAIVYDLKTKKEILSITEKWRVHAVSFSHDNKYLATGSFHGLTRIFDITNGKELKSFKINGLVHDVAFSKDGRFLVVGGDDNNVSIYLTNIYKE